MDSREEFLHWLERGFEGAVKQDLAAVVRETLQWDSGQDLTEDFRGEREGASEPHGKRALELLSAIDLAIFQVGMNIVIKPEAKPCQFKRLESTRIPLDAELCDMPETAERKAGLFVDLKLKEPAFVAALQAADWNNLGCLFVWRTNMDRGKAMEYYKKAKEAADYTALPPADQAIVEGNLALIQLAPQDLPDAPSRSSSGTIIRPLEVAIRRLVDMQRELGKEEIERIKAGQVKGLRFEIIE